MFPQLSYTLPYPACQFSKSGRERGPRLRRAEKRQAAHRGGSVGRLSERTSRPPHVRREEVLFLLVYEAGMKRATSFD